MNNKILFLVLIFALLASVKSHLYSQCNSLSLMVSDSICLNEELNIVNNTAESYNYQWDFCPASLMNGLTDVSTTSIGLDDPFSVEYAREGSNVYVFIVHRSSNKLVKAKFSSVLSASPTITDLGNIDGLLAGPQGFSVYQQGSNWYGLITNRDDKSVILLTFGSSIDNVPTASLSLNTGVDHMRTIRIVNQASDIYGVVAGGGSSGQIFVLKYGSSLTNTPTTLTNTFLGGNFPTSMAIYRDCSNWYGLVTSASNNKIYKMNYGANIESNPVVSEMAGISDPRGISLNKDNGKFYSYVASNSGGKLFRLDFGKNFEDNQYSIDQVGVSGVADLNASFGVYKYDSSFYNVIIGRTDKNLIVRAFSESCGVSDSYDESAAPSGIYYTTSGWKQIEIRYTSSGGLTSTTKDSVYVRNLPTAAYNVYGTCTAENAQFTDLSTTDNLSISDWQWDFDDPGSGVSNTSTLQFPTHIFDTPSTYNVSLMVTDICGQVDTNIIPIEIIDQNDLSPNFTVPLKTCSFAPLVFTDVSTYTLDEPQSWLWDFGGEGISLEQNPSFSFDNSGDFEVSLTVVGLTGCSKTVVKEINVIPGTEPDFSFDDACVGEQVDFLNTSIGTITDFNWDFGNGFNSTLENPSIEFANDGTYDVVLTLTNADGCVTFDTKPITIHALPSVDFSSELACENLDTQFTDLSSVTLDNLASWSWQFDDGTPNSDDQNPQHIFDSFGSYNVKLITTSTFGCLDSLEKTVTVLEAPIADFSFDKTCIDVPIQFLDQSVPVAGQDITDWAWNLGGTFSSEQNPSHTFNNALDYSVDLTVTSQNLCTSTQNISLTIPPAPTLAFDIEKDCANEIASLIDNSVITGDVVTQWLWEVDNQTLGDMSTISHQFPAVDNYNISLTLETENGCQYTYSRIIEIHPVPVALFNISFSFGAPPFEVQFVNNSSGANEYYWTFEPSAVSIESDPTYVFNNLGEFDVELVASNSFNCRDTTYQRIEGS